uniref:Secreted protein n=1 Tax=Oryza brachyantha TaxID=4533 RepID=J3MKK8_ORYBR
MACFRNLLLSCIVAQVLSRLPVVNCHYGQNSMPCVPRLYPHLLMWCVHGSLVGLLVRCVESNRLAVC